MNAPTKKLIAQIRVLAKHSYVEFTRKNVLHGYTSKILHLWHGGESVSKHCSGVDLAIIQTGTGGQIFAVLPLETLLSIMAQSEPKPLEPIELPLTQNEPINQ